MGTVTCFSWYRSDKQGKDNIAFLDEIRKEIKSRKLKDTAKSKDKASDQVEDIKEDNKKESSGAET